MDFIGFGKRLAATAALVLAAGAAHAVVISAADFPPSNPGTNTGSIVKGGLDLTVTSAPGNFSRKGSNPFVGIGITGGRTNDEIDVGETLTIRENLAAFSLASFTLGYLYDGPEFGDVQERAQVTAFLAGGGTLIGVLTNWYGDGPNATWSLAGATVNMLSDSRNSGSGAVAGDQAVWQVFNPFGSAVITRLEFTAVPGVSGCPAGTKCGNQSDYTFVGMDATVVPEPATLALLGLGLLGAGAAARRRRAR